MDRFDYLARRKQAELNQAALAVCPVEKNRHEEQARAYAKIISVLRREEEASLHVR
ncbi:hypothetical protein Sj15T_01280 [Sphingobium sp. TA15]|uniref:Uncharacterized protein n=2 Tax=Sphingobium indicum TaxID=332055 RepID=D4YZK4_SPHIU|nr:MULTISPECIES: hypothetical protein [Sphingobium]NYI23174.1 hypothetical protein [Sphingobium indicum]BAI95786.1 hypothetical protein SJA_C1-09520 [Sphingobium indicum UT26S]BDD65107.1 hypothetical protein Sj15T_01280 [Sphingobium sp. TA15]